MPKLIKQIWFSSQKKEKRKGKEKKVTQEPVFPRTSVASLMS